MVTHVRYRGRGGAYFLIVLIVTTCSSAAAQSTPVAIQEIIFDSQLGDAVFSMVLDGYDNLLLVGNRVPAEPSESLFIEGMLLNITGEGESSEIYVMNDHQVNTLVDIALDSQGNILLAGKGGVWEGQQSGYLTKLSREGEVLWNVEFPEIDYQDYVGIECNMTSDDVLFVGTASGSQEGVFLAMVNSTGALQWSQVWSEENYLGTPYTSHSLISYSQGFLVGVDSWDSFDIPFATAERTIAFSPNGTELWTFDQGLKVLYEMDDGNFLCSGYDLVAMCTPEREILWETEIELHCDYHSRILGFVANGSENIIAFGCVIGVGKSPVKSAFSLAYSPAPIPQTLIVSLDREGEIEWYDFYTLGERSMPCGAAFDQSGRLVLAGYSDDHYLEQAISNIWVVWNFQPTPFPDIIICDWTPIYLAIAAIPISLVLIWGLFRARKTSSPSDRVVRTIIRVFRGFGVISGAYIVFTTGIPLFPPGSFWPFLFGGVVSFFFILDSYIMERLVKLKSEESVVNEA